MNNIILYHASNAIIKQFDETFINSGTNNQELGSGFYFASKLQTVKTYGKYIHKCSVSINKALDVSKIGKIPVKIIKQLIIKAPNYLDTLNNFDDVSYYGQDKVLNIAANQYSTIGQISNALFSLQNDFYYIDPYLFNINVKNSQLGYDCIFQKRQDTIYNIFTKQQIQILQVIEN